MRGLKSTASWRLEYSQPKCSLMDWLMISFRPLSRIRSTCNQTKLWVTHTSTTTGNKTLYTSPHLHPCSRLPPLTSPGHILYIHGATHKLRNISKPVVLSSCLRHLLLILIEVEASVSHRVTKPSVPFWIADSFEPMVMGNFSQPGWFV